MGSHILGKYTVRLFSLESVTKQDFLDTVLNFLLIVCMQYLNCYVCNTIVMCFIRLAMDSVFPNWKDSQVQYLKNNISSSFIWGRLWLLILNTITKCWAIHTKTNTQVQKYTHTLTGTGHGGRVSLGTEVVFLTATVQRPFIVREAVRRTLWTLRVPQRRFVEACPTHWRQKNRYRQIHQHHAEPAHRQLVNSCIFSSERLQQEHVWNEIWIVFTALTHIQ